MNHVLIIIILLISFGCAAPEAIKTVKAKQGFSLDDTYREAQREFNKRNYRDSLDLFKKYINDNKSVNTEIDKKRVFWSIDHISRIYIKILKRPEEAVEFLQSVLKTVKLSGDEEEDVNEWLSVAKEWKKFGRMPKLVKSEEELFKLGQEYFQKGMDKLTFPADEAANADFYIASTYLIPYVFNYDNGKNIGKALFMLGNMRYRSWNDFEYWSENFYLKEVIRRFPNSKLSSRAYKVLEQGVHAGYTGSGGDHTPVFQLKMLKRYKVLAMPKKK